MVTSNLFKTSSNFLANRSKAILLLLIVFFCLVCVCYIVLSVNCSHIVNCWEKTGPLALLDLMFYVIFPYGVLGQVWILIVSIPELCILPFFISNLNGSRQIYRKIFGASEMHVSLGLAAVRSKVVVLLLLINFYVPPIVCGFSVLIFVFGMHYFVSFLALQSS